ncbi:hypothetical protein FB451DRAFT_1220176 [Mycena latifolia]|nr:hypothetical protein FB451DRAFT_1228830 [Mycena latifolia]KAJ7490483.1 hypothetical protein FB451DRAFT_1220176 [Mycena latifolia]
MTLPGAFCAEAALAATDSTPGMSTNSTDGRPVTRGVCNGHDRRGCNGLGDVVGPRRRRGGSGAVDVLPNVLWPLGWGNWDVLVQPMLRKPKGGRIVLPRGAYGRLRGCGNGVDIVDSVGNEGVGKIAVVDEGGGRWVKRRLCEVAYGGVLCLRLDSLQLLSLCSPLLPFLCRRRFRHYVVYVTTKEKGDGVRECVLKNAVDASSR